MIPQHLFESKQEQDLLLQQFDSIQGLPQLISNLKLGLPINQHIDNIHDNNDNKVSNKSLVIHQMLITRQQQRLK